MRFDVVNSEHGIITRPDSSYKQTRKWWEDDAPKWTSYHLQTPLGCLRIERDGGSGLSSHQWHYNGLSDAGISKTGNNSKNIEHNMINIKVTALRKQSSVLLTQKTNY